MQKRATLRTLDYFYHPLQNTPFSLGIALPQDYGKYRMVGKIDVANVRENSKQTANSYSRKGQGNTLDLFQCQCSFLMTTGESILTGSTATTTTVTTTENMALLRRQCATSLHGCSRRAGLGERPLCGHCHDATTERTTIRIVTRVSSLNFISR